MSVPQKVVSARNEPTFQSIRLFKSHLLGIGSSGKVCKAKCDTLLCAAKLFTPILSSPTTSGLDSEQLRFTHEECKFLCSIKHPNIVQFLGTFEDPENGLPVLLMELMDESLTSFLERSQRNLPYHIEVIITHDIALALSFLHSNGLIHRDLSSNNVLMIGNSRAKVTGFGMAGANPQATRVPLPQTPSYMPPEATQIPPVYTDKSDCFSHGVLVVQIITRQFPKPGEHLKTVAVHDPPSPLRCVKVCVPEVERRHKHIKLIDPHHPLLPVALSCLLDDPSERPSSQEICDGVAAIKQGTEFTQSVRKQATLQQSENAVMDLQREVHTQSQMIQRLQKALADSEYNLAALKSQAVTTNGVELSKDDSIVQKLEQLKLKLPQASPREETTMSYPDQLLEHSLVMPHNTLHRGSEGPLGMNLKWRDGKSTLLEMSRGPDALVHGNVMYLSPGFQQVHGYSFTTDCWFQLPECPHKIFSLAVVDNLLTAIGGQCAGQCTNKLLSWIKTTEGMLWKELLPPMPTKRSLTCVVSDGTVLVVMGGCGDKDVLSSVEVLDVNTKCWSTAASLLKPLYEASATICGNRIYILGACNTSGSATKSVFMCSLSALLESCTAVHSAAVWSKIADFKHTQSTCVVFHGRLLAIGGRDSFNIPTAAVQMYNLATNCWKVISHVTMPRRRCFAAVLTENELAVVGGCTGRSIYTQTDSVEIAYV